MESPNIKHIPINQQGAIELGFCPCDYCGLGWAHYSIKEHKSCHDTCPDFSKWFQKELEKRCEIAETKSYLKAEKSG